MQNFQWLKPEGKKQHPVVIDVLSNQQERTKRHFEAYGRTLPSLTLSELPRLHALSIANDQLAIGSVLRPRHGGIASKVSHTSHEIKEHKGPILLFLGNIGEQRGTWEPNHRAT